MNDYRDLAWPSVGRIAEKCSLGERAVQNNLKAICKAGYLVNNGRSNLGTNMYAICTPALDAPPHLNTDTPAADAPELTKELTNTLSKGFKRPTVEEVKAYCDEKGYTIDPETFVNYYNSNGWKVGRSSMKCWKSATTNWNKRENKNDQANNANRGQARPAPNQRRRTKADEVREAREAARARFESRPSDMGNVVKTD